MLSNVVILLTPFQLRQLVFTIEQYHWSVEHAVFYSLPLVSKEEIMASLNLDIMDHYYIPDESISLSRMLRNPFKEIPKHRSSVKNLAQFINTSLNDKACYARLIIGSDKDVFSQLLMDKLSNQEKKITICALDEGTGYYKEMTIKDNIYKVVYFLFSRFIFGHKFRFIGTLGHHPMIDEVYVRFIDFVPQKKTWIKYFQINPRKRSTVASKYSRDILFLTSPLQEDNHCSQSEESVILKEIFSLFSDNNLKVDVKPHPRELKNKYQNFLNDSIVMLDPKKSAEEIDYFNYKRIVNFGSSIVLDVYQEGYPMENLVTLDTQYSINKLAESLYRKGVYIPLFAHGFKEKFKNVVNEISE